MRPGDSITEVAVRGEPFTRRCVLAAALAACVVAAYGGVWSHEFVNWDDSAHLTENRYFWPPSERNLAQLWRAPYFHEYVPLTYTFWWLEADLSTGAQAGTDAAELNPAVFHAGNLALHILAALAAWRLLGQLCGPGFGPWAGAMLFALHPLAVESAAWVSESRGLLAGLFSLLALDQYLTCSRTWQSCTSRRRWRLHYAALLGFYVLALLSKSSASVVPLIAVVLDAARFGPRHLRRTWRALAPLAGLALVALLIMKWQQPSDALTEVAPLWGRPLVAADALTFYIRKLLWPAGLAADYGRQPSQVLAEPSCWVAAILLATLIALLAWRRPRAQWLGPAGVFVAALAPVLGIVPFRYQVISTVADRYAYLALLGPAWALAHWLTTGRPRLATRALTVAGLLALGICSWHQQQFWQNTATLFTRVLEVNPRSLPALTSLGDVYRVRGEFDQALACLNRAIELGEQNGPRPDPQNTLASAHYNLANVLADLGRTGEAIDHYRAALAIDPDFAKAHNNLGLALASGGLLYDAIDHYEQALRIKPANAKAQYNLGEALERLGLRNEALSHYRLALRFEPRHADAWNNLANIQAALGRDDLAEPAYREALRVDPRNYQAHYNLSLLLVRGGHAIEAGEHLRRALEIQPRLEIARRALDQIERMR